MLRRLAALTALGFVAAVSSPAFAVDDVDGPAVATAQAVRTGDVHQTEEPPPPPPPATATYRVTLHVDWTSATHPTTVPPGPHVSPPVVVTHRDEGDLFAPGTLASDGIERMAEVGATATLVAEQRSRPTVTSVQTGRRIDFSGTQSWDLTFDQATSWVSLVTMLAPSPDWFVGIREQLFTDGGWRDTFTVDLGDYDAGTDSAPGFVHSNVDTVPAQPISGPRDAAFAAAAAENRFGFVTIERIG